MFQIILDEWETPRELLTAWQPLALTCRAWRSALLGTPVGLELKATVHLGEPALRWMARAQLEVRQPGAGVGEGAADTWGGGRGAGALGRGEREQQAGVKRSWERAARDCALPPQLGNAAQPRPAPPPPATAAVPDAGAHAGSGGR